MNKTDDALWLTFEALAKTHPHDDGVRMTADFARWLLEERRRLQMPAPPIMRIVVRVVTEVLHGPAAKPFRRTPVTDL